MKAILHMRLFWRGEHSVDELNGVKVIEVADSFGAGMGVVCHRGADPVMPDAVYSNSAGSLVIYLEDEVPESSAREILRVSGLKDASSMETIYGEHGSVSDATIPDVSCVQEGF